MLCPTCGAKDVIEIKQNLPDTTVVWFFSCHKCDEKWWDHEGRQLELKDVLDLARRAHS